LTPGEFEQCQEEAVDLPSTPRETLGAAAQDSLLWRSLCNHREFAAHPGTRFKIIAKTIRGKKPGNVVPSGRSYAPGRSVFVPKLFIRGFPCPARSLKKLAKVISKNLRTASSAGW
jgi:hypothetical protein